MRELDINGLPFHDAEFLHFEVCFSGDTHPRVTLVVSFHEDEIPCVHDMLQSNEAIWALCHKNCEGVSLFLPPVKKANRLIVDWSTNRSTDGKVEVKYRFSDGSKIELFCSEISLNPFELTGGG
jgi:hypothetical protein